jgi:hypothetical protein
MTPLAILAPLLRDALPGLVPLDLTLPAGHLLPYWPGCRAGMPEAALLSRAEQVLLTRFRQHGGLLADEAGRGLPLFGIDRAADAALLAGAPAAWEAGLPLLILNRLADGPRGLLAAGAMVLLRHEGAASEATLGFDLGRIMLLAGTSSQVERYDLLLPPAQVPEIFEALRGAAGRFAATRGGWRIGGRLVDSRLASLGILSQRPGLAGPALRYAPRSLPHDRRPDARDLATAAPQHDWRQGRSARPWDASLALTGAGRARPRWAGPGPAPEEAERDPMSLAPGERVRFLIGALPAAPTILRARFSGLEPEQAPGLFQDGLLIAPELSIDLAGIATLEAAITPRAGEATVIGIAHRARAGGAVALLDLEIGG